MCKGRANAAGADPVCSWSTSHDSVDGRRRSKDDATRPARRRQRTLSFNHQDQGRGRIQQVVGGSLHRADRSTPLDGAWAISEVTLGVARRQAASLRASARAGVDPLEERRAKRREAAERVASAMTFRQCAEGFIETHRHSWRNAKHAAQWRSSLAAYVYPVFGDVDVSQIDTALVARVLDPIWTKKNETASRVRGRIENILDGRRRVVIVAERTLLAGRGACNTRCPHGAKLRRPSITRRFRSMKSACSCANFGRGQVSLHV